MGEEAGERHVDTDRFRGGLLQRCELGGLEVRDCEVSGLKIVDCYGGDVSVAGAFDRVMVNDVDVTAYVEGELDRRVPERRLVRDATTPDDFRATWQAVERLWAPTVARARALPAGAVHERVDGEFSFVETLRHLLFATDAWLGNAILEEPAPFHPWGIPVEATPAAGVAALGLTLDAAPTLEEVLDASSARAATLRRTVDGLTEAELDRTCRRRPAEFYPDQEYVVSRCLRVVLREHVEHHRYAVRDLDVLEARSAAQ